MFDTRQNRNKVGMRVAVGDRTLQDPEAIVKEANKRKRKRRPSDHSTVKRKQLKTAPFGRTTLERTTQTSGVPLPQTVDSIFPEGFNMRTNPQPRASTPAGTNDATFDRHPPRASEHAPEGTGFPSLPHQVGEALVKVRDRKVEQDWLRGKLLHLREQLGRRRYRLEDLTWQRALGERVFDKRLDSFVPQNEVEHNLVEQYHDAASTVVQAEVRLSQIEQELDFSRRRLADHILEAYGTQIPSERELRVPYDEDKGWDIESDVAAVEGADSIRHDPVKDPMQGPSQATQISRTFSWSSDDLDPDYKARKERYDAKIDRREAKRAMSQEQVRFDEFWCSFQEYKRLFNEQRAREGGTDSLTEFGGDWFQAGQVVTHRLKYVRQQYRKAALKAKRLKVTDLSEDQTSLFPSDDGIDEEKYDEELRQARDRMDENFIMHWIDDDWIQGGASCFKEAEAPPSEDTSEVPRDEALLALSEIGFGRDEEFQATERRRMHIDKWNWRRKVAQQTMLEQWGQMRNERWDVPEELPPSPRPDHVGSFVPGTG